MNFLILTDHAGHSDQNSLYALARTLAADARTNSVFVASRSDERNDAFFEDDLNAPLYGLTVGPDFRYAAGDDWLNKATGTARYAEAKVVWLRLPPPADRAFFGRLTSFAPASAHVIVNDPAGILETGSKAFLHHFPDHTAEVRGIQSVKQVRRFVAERPIVLKPLDEYGGRGLVKIINQTVETDGAEYDLDTWLAANEAAITSGRYLAMKYLKNVGRGDKRILVVNGKILGASLRIPAEGQWLCNVSKGGTSVLADVMPEEKAMIAAVAPVLLAKGVVIFGADTLVDDDGRRVLSELNTNSIGGFPQAEAQTGRPILQQTINGIYDYLAERTPRAAGRS